MVAIHELLQNHEELTDEEVALRESLAEYLRFYFSHIQPSVSQESSTVGAPSMDDLHTEALNVDERLEAVTDRAFQILLRNNRMAELYASTEYEEAVVGRLKELRGDCAIGATICVDGRIAIPELFSRVVSVWESKAGILGMRSNPFAGEPAIESSRLVKAIESRAEKNGPLLDILFAHRSSDPHHSCGAMGVLEGVHDPEVVDKLEQIRLAKEEGTIATEYNDLVLANILINADRADDLKKVYNTSVNDPSNRLDRVAITAVYNTDNMTIEFGYGTDHFVSTAQFLRVLRPVIDNLNRGHFGSWKDRYANIDKKTQLDFDSLQVDIMEDLMTDCHLFQELFDQLLQTQPDLGELTPPQQRALQIVVAKNVAFHYLTGICFETDPSHPHHDHHEIAQSVNLDGVNVGQFDPEGQVFGASPATAADAVLHINVQTNIMNKDQALKLPHIVYICKATTDDQADGITERASGHNRDFFLNICSDPSIMKRMQTGEIIPIPVDINDRTRQVKRVFLHRN